MEKGLKKDMLEMTFDLDRFFQPGYVIELCENTYYRGVRNRRALAGALPQAERVPGMEAAEKFVHRHLLAGMYVSVKCAGYCFVWKAKWKNRISIGMAAGLARI